MRLALLLLLSAGLVDGCADDAQQATSTPDVRDVISPTVGIERVEVYQALSVIDVGPGDAVTRRATVVEGRALLVRVHLRVDGASEPVPVRLRLIPTGISSAEPLAQTTWVATSSTQDSLDSTPHFDVPPQWVQPSLGLAVVLEAVEPGAFIAGAVRMPTVGALAVEPKPGAIVRIALAPFRLNVGDGSWAPSLGDAEFDRMADQLRARWPITAVEWTLLPVRELPGAFDPWGDGWDRLLAASCALREELTLDDAQLVYGLATPAPTLDDFCRFGCRAGLAPPVAEAALPGARCAVGLGFDSDTLAGTMAHELAHALGRRHSPCGDFGTPSEPDPTFPDPDGHIGTWGYDSTTETLHPPKTPDFMGYCEPAWVSPHTWDGLQEALQRLK